MPVLEQKEPVSATVPRHVTSSRCRIHSHQVPDVEAGAVASSDDLADACGAHALAEHDGLDVRACRRHPPSHRRVGGEEEEADEDVARRRMRGEGDRARAEIARGVEHALWAGAEEDFERRLHFFGRGMDGR